MPMGPTMVCATMTEMTNEKKGTTIIEMYSGVIFLKNPLHIDQHKGGQHGGDDLRLVADHLDLGKAEVPHRDVRRGGGGQPSRR